MTFNPSIPNPGDYIDEAQPQIKENFTVLDSTFDVDHYKFSDATANIGKHKTVTTPAEAAHVSTAADEPVLYAYEDLAALGVLQYSRGGSDATPTPLTALHGNIASLTTTPQTIIDFSGLGFGFFGLYVCQLNTAATGVWYPIFFDGTQIANASIGGGTFDGVGSTNVYLVSASSSTILQIRRASGTAANVKWTLVPHRTEA